MDGDVVLEPMSKACLDRLMEIEMPTHFIHGNCEGFVLDFLNGNPLKKQVPEKVLENIKWTAEQLDSSYKDLLASWPKTIELEVEGIGKVLFCHATPRDENEIFTRLTSEEKLRPIFENLEVNVVVCGHTHMQFDRTIGGIRVVNSGSVGMPFGEPGAYWLLLDKDIRFQHTQYDLEKAAGIIRRTNFPQRDDFAANNVLKPPTEAEMLQILTT